MTDSGVSGIVWPQTDAKGEHIRSYFMFEWSLVTHLRKHVRVWDDTLSHKEFMQWEGEGHLL